MDKPEYKLSVVLTVHDQADDVERNLPILLSQQYDAGYEVIVVNEASTDETPDVLKRLGAEYSHLYTTFIPKSVPNPSQKRLALTIGAKAAKNDYVVLADITRPPRTPQSLQLLAYAISNAGGDEVVMAYRGRRKNDGERYQTWATLDDAAPLLRKAERRNGRGHQGRYCVMHRGLYEAVAVPRRIIHDTLRYYDCELRGIRLWSHRLRIFLKSL